MRNDNGFSLIEVLVAFSIVLIITTTIIPLTSLLNNEEAVLSERRKVTNHLHDELQLYLWKDNKKIPASYSKTLESNTVTYQFSVEKELIKGCVKWQNVKKRKEKVCLYGYRSD
ncbi:prepilin-type N-terminal cleavage/methylation domain-containing protein [Lentibacillus sp. Marseille-P4043]|uniref:prepilin-type N-terminal cleavage/methylation domain-containing protein n=1 Tax=Lentibacillus sp. Marseille-P4043 TaxID=2040293 RepID=UPI00131A4C3E|nr:prepilin-type N-terminal cleavage/methylation domain-containing protein [Lentibacillus sp. Marseille-P4043]